jgi:hypothetical protein
MGRGHSTRQIRTQLVHLFPAIQPKNEFDIVIIHSKNKELHISARSDESSILFTKREYLRTFVFENYFYIIVFALTASIVMIGIGLINQLLRQRPNKVKKPSR